MLGNKRNPDDEILHRPEFIGKEVPKLTDWDMKIRREAEQSPEWGEYGIRRYLKNKREGHKVNNESDGIGKLEKFLSNEPEARFKDYDDFINQEGVKDKYLYRYRNNPISDRELNEYKREMDREADLAIKNWNDPKERQKHLLRKNRIFTESTEDVDEDQYEKLRDHRIATNDRIVSSTGKYSPYETNIRIYEGMKDEGHPTADTVYWAGDSEFPIYASSWPWTGQKEHPSMPGKPYRGPIAGKMLYSEMKGRIGKNPKGRFNEILIGIGLIVAIKLFCKK